MNAVLMSKIDDLTKAVTDLPNALLEVLNDSVENGFSTTEIDIITYEQAMEILQCSRDTLDRWRSEGLIKVYAFKRRLYMKKSELIAAMEENLLTK